MSIIYIFYSSFLFSINSTKGEIDLNWPFSFRESITLISIMCIILLLFIHCYYLLYFFYIIYYLYVLINRANRYYLSFTQKAMCCINDNYIDRAILAANLTPFYRNSELQHQAKFSVRDFRCSSNGNRNCRNSEVMFMHTSQCCNICVSY